MTHPDRRAVAINSLRALLCRCAWFRVERELPDEVRCCQGYNPEGPIDFYADVSSMGDVVRESICYWHRFGEGDENALWLERSVDHGMAERFHVAQADPVCFSVAGEQFPGKVTLNAVIVATPMQFHAGQAVEALERARRVGHGGRDYLVARAFVEAALGRRPGRSTFTPPWT